MEPLIPAFDLLAAAINTCSGAPPPDVRAYTYELACKLDILIIEKSDKAWEQVLEWLEEYHVPRDATNVSLGIACAMMALFQCTKNSYPERAFRAASSAIFKFKWKSPEAAASALEVWPLFARAISAGNELLAVSIADHVVAYAPEESTERIAAMKAYSELYIKSQHDKDDRLWRHISANTGTYLLQPQSHEHLGILKEAPKQSGKYGAKQFFGMASRLKTRILNSISNLQKSFCDHFNY